MKNITRDAFETLASGLAEKISSLQLVVWTMSDATTLRARAVRVGGDINIVVDKIA